MNSPLFQNRITHRSWLALAAVVTLLSTAVLFVPQAQATSSLDEGILAAPQPQNQFFNDDVKVEKGQVLEGDVVVYRGDIEVDDEGVITGDLIVLSGKVEIKKEGKVLGDLTAFSGDIKIEGEVQGDVASASGDVSLEKSAIVHGDVSVVAGEVKRHRDAQVLGRVNEGPNIQMPNLPSIADLTLTEGNTIDIEISRDRTEIGFFGWLISRFFRLLFALLLAVGLAGLVGLITISRPEFVEEAAASIKDQFALSFGVGLVTNVFLLVVSAFLIATLCLAIIAVVPILGITVLGVLSWAGVSLLVGHRVVRYAKTSAKSATTATMGALAMALPIAILWSFGSCFRFVALLLLLVISSAGSGAFILPWLRKFGDSSASRTKPVSTATAPPAAKNMSAVVNETNIVSESVAEESIAVNMEAAPDADSDDNGGDDNGGGDADTRQDDFTRISGIGPTFGRRLAAANIHTFEQFAARSADEIAEILGWPVERVTRDNLIEQARTLASEG